MPDSIFHSDGMNNLTLMPDNSIWNPTASFLRNVDLELVFYGSEQCAPNKAWGPGIKNHYKVHYVHSGKGVIHTSGQIFAASAGQCFVFYPDEKVYYAADEENPWRYSWVAFDGSNAEFYLKRAGIQKGSCIIDHCNKEVLEQVFEQLLSIDLADVNKDMKFIGMLYMILSAIMVSPPTGDAMRPLKHPIIYVKTAIKFIQDNYAQDITVAQISEHLALERKYFSRIFKQSLHVSPGAYIIHYRLLKACDLLDKTSLGVGEIASSIGYNNQFSFSRMFKKYKGISPSEYRNRNPR